MSAAKLEDLSELKKSIEVLVKLGQMGNSQYFSDYTGYDPPEVEACMNVLEREGKVKKEIKYINEAFETIYEGSND